MTNKNELEQNFLDISADGADIAIDLLTDSELLKDIPVAGLIYKLGKTLSSIPDVMFLHKVGRFLKTVNEKTTENERITFAEELKKDKDKRDRLYSAIFLKIDKFDDVTKSDLFAKIFACFVTNKVRQTEFIALSSALNLATLEEMKAFSKSYWKARNYVAMDSYKSHGKDYGSLLSTHFVSIILDESRRLSKTETPYSVDFIVTELGCLYAYISEDFEDYFSFIKDAEKSRLLPPYMYAGTSREYGFESPSRNEEFRVKVQQKFPSTR